MSWLADLFLPGLRQQLQQQQPTRPPTPPSPPLLQRPWRNLDWGQRQADLDYVKDFRPQDEAQQIRVLLYGPAGAGKSSFINSVHSVLHGRVYRQALEDNTGGKSFTKQYKAYKIPKGRSGAFYPFVFTDIMGLEAKGGGVHVDDIKLALKGHVKDGYKFNPESRLSEEDQFYNRHPTANDKIHVLVCVIPADAVSRMNDETLRKIRDIREEATRLNIVQMIMITKVDLVCPEITKNLRDVYKSKLLKKKMEQISVDVGIPMNCIFPVKNYHEEIQPNTDADSLILSALRNIIEAGNDCINYNRV
ncbi:uncharacterized protein V6R79_018002 [Siganus canaliculatus]